MEKFFKLKERSTDIRTEVIAGATTFLAMAYILIINPAILGEAGMDRGAVFTATALSAAIATAVMALLANLPYALAPGMGLNAFFAYTVVLGMGYSWETALAAVFIEGIIFILLTIFNVREAIIRSIPPVLRNAISGGLGLFIAFIGLQNAGIITAGRHLVELGDITSIGPELLAVIGLVLTAALLVLKVRGALLMGIAATALLGIPMGVTVWHGGSFLPPSLSPTFCRFDFTGIFSFEFLIIVFTFLCVDMFDTAGTLIGCATEAGMVDEDGSIPNAKEALFADAVGTTVGAILGTSTVTTTAESSTGVIAGGRTGLTALTAAALFPVSLFLSPLFLSIPAAAASPALVIVGFSMMGPVKGIDFSEPTEGLPAFLCMLMMLLSYSVSDGMMFGILSYVVMKAVARKWESLSIPTVVLALIFLLKLFVE